MEILSSALQAQDQYGMPVAVMTADNGFFRFMNAAGYLAVLWDPRKVPGASLQGYFAGLVGEYCE
jgi:hypothetical protein